MSDQKQQVLEFLTSNNLAALATVGTDNNPNVASVYAIADDQLNFYIFTKDETTKFKNLKAKPTVALAITNQQSQQTIQLKGSASVVTSPEERIDVLNKLTAIAGTDEYPEAPISKIQAGQYAVVQIIPTWLRWGDFTKSRDTQSTRIFTQIIPASTSK